ncbi:MAG: hypothetical protein E7349_01275 [Clostridiales bacterium]|nr:hypothetical protein [Clostridiales bacterium]
MSTVKLNIKKQIFKDIQGHKFGLSTFPQHPTNTTINIYFNIIISGVSLPPKRQAIFFLQIKQKKSTEFCSSLTNLLFKLYRKIERQSPAERWDRKTKSNGTLVDKVGSVMV